MHLFRGVCAFRLADNEVISLRFISELFSELIFGHGNLKVRNKIISVTEHLHDGSADPEEASALFVEL